MSTPSVCSKSPNCSSGKILSFLALIFLSLFFGSIPRTARSKTSSGFRSNTDLTFSSFKPPTYPVCQRYSFWSTFFPVNATCRAFTTTTLSPVSMWGKYVGLCFPTSILEMSVASLPTTWSFASILCHRGFATTRFAIRLPTFRIPVADMMLKNCRSFD